LVIRGFEQVKDKVYDIPFHMWRSLQ